MTVTETQQLPAWAQPSAPFAERVFPLEECEVLRAEQGGDGRTVRAYAAVYERPVLVTEYGDTYEEIIRAGAFRKTIAAKRTSFQVFYNHGKTLHGTPAERFAMPIGVPIEVSEDSRGVLTVTRYSKTELADEILELISDGALRAQSFSGLWIQNKLTLATKPGQLDRVERLEIAMREYGPTPFPVYEAAKILGVRSTIAALSPEDRATLLAELSTSDAAADAGTGAVTPPEAGTTSTDQSAAGDDAGTGLESPPAEILALLARNRRRRNV